MVDKNQQVSSSDSFSCQNNACIFVVSICIQPKRISASLQVINKV